MKKIEIILRDLVRQKKLIIEIIIVGGILFSYLLYLLFFAGQPISPVAYILGWPVTLMAAALFAFRPLVALKLILFVFTVGFMRKIAYSWIIPLGSIRFTFPEIVSILFVIILIPMYFLKQTSRDIPLSKCFKIFYAASLIPLLVGMRTWGSEHAIRDFVSVYYTVFYFIVVLVVTKGKEVRSLVKWFIVATIFVAITSGRILILSGASIHSAAHMMYLSFAVYLLGALLQGGYLNRKKKFFFVILLICYLAILFTTSTRGGFFAFIGGAAPLLAFSRFKHKVILLVVLLLIVGALLFSYQQGMFGGKETLNKIVEGRVTVALNPEKDGTGSWRLSISRIGWRYFLAHPIVGNGYGFGFWAPWWKKQVYCEWRAAQIHNSYLFILISSGVIGFFGFLTIIFTVFQKCFKNVFTSNPARRIVAIITVSCFVNFLITCWSNPALHSAHIGGVGWICLALGMRALGMSDEELTNLFLLQNKEVES